MLGSRTLAGLLSGRAPVGDDGAAGGFRLPRRLRVTVATLVPVVVTEEARERGLVEATVEGVEAFLGALPAHLRAGLVAGIGAFEASAAVTPGSLGRGFSGLGPEAARAHFARWWESGLGPVHQLARALKIFVAFAYYELPAVQEGIGYRPAEFIARVARERRQRWDDVIARHEAEVVRGAPRPLPRAGGGPRA